MSGEFFLFLIVFVSLAIMGMKKSWKWFDSGDKVKSAAQGWFVNRLKW